MFSPPFTLPFCMFSRFPLQRWNYRSAPALLLSLFHRRQSASKCSTCVRFRATVECFSYGFPVSWVLYPSEVLCHLSWHGAELQTQLPRPKLTVLLLTLHPHKGCKTNHNPPSSHTWRHLPHPQCLLLILHLPLALPLDPGWFACCVL